MRAWLHPVNATSIAEGRSAPPPAPQEAIPFLQIRAVNHFLGAQYRTYDELMADYDEDELEMLLMIIGAMG